MSVPLPSSTVPRTDEAPDLPTTVTPPPVSRGPLSSLLRRLVCLRPPLTEAGRSARMECASTLYQAICCKHVRLTTCVGETLTESPLPFLRPSERRRKRRRRKRKRRRLTRSKCWDYSYARDFLQLSSLFSFSSVMRHVTQHTQTNTASALRHSGIWEMDGSDFTELWM